MSQIYHTKAIQIMGNNIDAIKKVFGLEVTSDHIRKYLLFDTHEMYQIADLNFLLDEYRLIEGTGICYQDVIGLEYLSVEHWTLASEFS